MKANVEKRPESGVDFLMGLASGYRPAATLFAAQRLGVFGAMAKAPKTAKQVAAATKCDAQAMERLMNALASLGLLKKEGNRFCLSKTSEAHLIPGAPGYMGAFLDHSLRGWEGWGRLEEAVKTGKALDGKADRVYLDDEAWRESFILTMDQGSQERAIQMAEALDLRGVKRSLDIGGGPGTYSYALVAQKKGLSATVFDLPKTLNITRRLIAERGMEGRVDVLPGDVRHDPFGKGYDLALLSNILHCFGPRDVAAIVKKAARALNPGGQMVINEFVLNDDKAGPPVAALFSLNMLMNTAGGASYSETEYRQWLQKAGLEKIKRVDYCHSHSVIVGRKPK